MQVKNDAAADYRPLLLRRNISYPTFQLHATAGAKGVPQDTVLKIVILETMQWLRQRFREFELPNELDMPESSRYCEVDLTAFKSFHLDMGYKLEVIWLPDDKIWTLQLTEPDLGTQKGAVSGARAPVPGRLFETNIAYRIGRGGVECGFKTVASDPEGTDAPCEVFRLAFIKNLARNPLVGFKTTWQIMDSAHRLSGASEIKRLSAWLKDENRMMPAVIFSERVKEKPAGNSLLMPKELPSLHDDKPYLCKFRSMVPDEEDRPCLPFDISRITRYKMGFAQFFVLPSSMRESFADVTNVSIGNGEILVLEPKALGGEITRYPCDDTVSRRNAVKKELERFITNYPKGKAMTFGDCVFVPQAKEMEREKVIALYRSKKDITESYSEKLRAEEDKHRRELLDLKKELTAKDEKINRLDRKVKEVEAEKGKLREESKRAEGKFKAKLDEKESEISRLKFLLTRPQKTNEVSEWAGRFFDGRLIFHDRAKDMMQKVQPEKVNLPLLCDALEYLALEYRDELIGKISDAQRDSICSKKYGRPFEVISDRGRSADMFPDEYKIDYFCSKGKPSKRTLDLHLRVGSGSQSLIRIYFFYDDEKKLIVVGSLPGHLKTASDK